MCDVEEKKVDEISAVVRKPEGGVVEKGKWEQGKIKKGVQASWHKFWVGLALLSSRVKVRSK